VEPRRWVNQTLPQTLHIAVLLLYLNAFFSILAGFTAGAIILVVIGFAQVAAGKGIANERRWGYYLGVGMAVLATVALLWVGGSGLIGLLFDVALIALLVHPQSRDYQKIWFR